MVPRLARETLQCNVPTPGFFTCPRLPVGRQQLWNCCSGPVSWKLAHYLEFASCSLAAAITWSGSNPNFRCNSFNGADAPKVFMPTTFPEAPTYRSQPKVEACSTATLAFTFGGSTLSR